MRRRFAALLRKEMKQLLRSRKTVIAAAMVPALMLLFVAFGNILTLKVGFASKEIYLLSSTRRVSGAFLLQHYTLPVFVTISALVVPSIVMGDLLFGERERRTLDLLVALPVSVYDVVLAKLTAVLGFAICVIGPLFVLNTLMVSAAGYGAVPQTAALAGLLVASVCYSTSSALLVAVVAGEARAANIVSGLVLGPVVPVEGLVLAAVKSYAAIVASASVLLAVACVLLIWSLRLLSFERLAGG